MIELKGKYGTAKVFTDLVEQEAISQVINVLNQPYADGEIIRMMPDIHAGIGCTIGTTMTVSDKVCPNLVGVDISCGMYTVQISRDSDLDFEKLDDALTGRDGLPPIVPSGMNIRSQKHVYSDFVDIRNLRCADRINIDRAYYSIGTLGGGNHFIEVNKNQENGDVYLVIHTGSRYLGKQVCEYYQNKAAEHLSGPTKDERNEIISYLKKRNSERAIPKALKELENSYPHVPKDLAWCSGKMLDDYLYDIRIVHNYAYINRKAIADSLCSYMHWDVLDAFETVHNYIDTENMILRKGAVSARQGEKLLIPINMRDGSLICIGKGNADWNYSAPHGAGRLMSRSQAKETISLSAFQEAMNGIYSTSISTSTIDESPMAYKPMESIIDNIEPTVEIESVIKPLYNFKAS